MLDNWVIGYIKEEEEWELRKSTKYESRWSWECVAMSCCEAGLIHACSICELDWLDKAQLPTTDNLDNSVVILCY